MEKFGRRNEIPEDDTKKIQLSEYKNVGDNGDTKRSIEEIDTEYENRISKLLLEGDMEGLSVDDLLEDEEVISYFDDNGMIYRIGKELLPNCEYELNGYKYVTDGLGRIVSVSGKLHMKDREDRLKIKDTIEDIGKGDQREGDDRGHLIGDQFDGSNGLENMIPQDADINRNAYKNFENELAKEVKAGRKVEIKIELVYEGESRRPTALVVTYWIDGEKRIKVFPNGQED